MLEVQLRLGWCTKDCESEKNSPRQKTFLDQCWVILWVYVGSFGGLWVFVSGKKTIENFSETMLDHVGSMLDLYWIMSWNLMPGRI